MSSTDILREDHRHIKRLEKVIVKCYQDLYQGKNVPLEDIEKITLIIEEFLDSIHYSREEDSYFPCVATYGSLKKEIRTFMIEHEFGRRIAKKITINLQRWKKGEDAREPVARFLKTYSIYLQDHISKEEKFLDKAEQTILSKEEENEMFEQFKSVMAITRKVNELIEEIIHLENQPWFKNSTV